MLYTLSRSPFASHAFADILQLVTEQDVVLLWSDGVIAATRGNDCEQHLASCCATCYVLQEDVQARGLQSRLNSNVQLIDYSGWVSLTEQHPQQVAY